MERFRRLIVEWFIIWCLVGFRDNFEIWDIFICWVEVNFVVVLCVLYCYVVLRERIRFVGGDDSR